MTTLRPNTVLLNNVEYAIDLKGYSHASQSSQRDGVVQTATADDSLYNTDGAWQRYRASWHHGAGASIMDLENNADPYMFDSSYGVDVWTRGKLTLLNQTTSFNLAAGTGPSSMSVSSGLLYIGLATDLRQTLDLTTFTLCTAPGGAVASMSTDGTDLYVATSTGMVKYVAGATTPTAFATAVVGNCTMVSFCAGRLLLAKSNVLYEVASSGVLTAVKTHFQPSFLWKRIIAVGSRLYAIGATASRSEIYTITTDSLGALVVGSTAADLPAGETVNEAVAYVGVILLATNKGVRMATPNADGSITYGPAITAGGNCYAMATDGRFAWCAGLTRALHAGTIRLALDTTTAPLLPAYAADVEITLVGSHEVMSVARYNNKTVMVTYGGFLYYENTTPVTTGEVLSGRITYGTVEEKYLSDLDAQYDLPVADASANVQFTLYKTGTSEYVTGMNVATTQALGSISSPPWNMGHSANRGFGFGMRISLLSSGIATPTLFSWRLRAYPITPVVHQWIVPLLVKSHVRVGEGEGELMHFDPTTTMWSLHTLWRSKTPITYQEGSMTCTVRVDAFEQSVEEWDDAGGYFESIVKVKLVSIGDADLYGNS